MKNVIVYLVTFRRFEFFKRTVESLMETLPLGSNICVAYNTEGRHEDDQKYQDYFADLFKRFPISESNTPFVQVLDTGTNEGWGASMNELIGLYSFEGYEYVLESNNDVEYVVGWFDKAKALMCKYHKIGILGLWSHVHHGIKEDLGDLLIKDNMPATCWLFRPVDLQAILPFKERGVCKTRGGNGEDTEMVIKTQARGLWVCGTKPDLAHHMDGYDVHDLGKPNEAYR